MSKLGHALIVPELRVCLVYALPFSSGTLISVYYKTIDGAMVMLILSLIHILSLVTRLCM